MSLRQLIDSTRREWTDAEERVLAVLLSSGGAGEQTVTAVARAAGTHESTVVRLAQRLGYDGYGHLRRELRASYRSDLRRRGPVESVSVSAEVGAGDLEALRSLGRTVSPATLTTAAADLHRAQHVYIFAKNDDEPLRDLLGHRLRRLGKSVHPLGSAAKDLAERIQALGPDSALIAFALGKPSRYLADLVAEADRRGAATVLVTDGSASPFQPAPRSVLAVPRPERPEHSTDLVAMALCYAIARAVVAMDPGRYAEAARRVDDLSRVLGGAGDTSARRSI